MTNDDLARWLALADGATTGPWKWSDGFLWNEAQDQGVLAHGEEVQWDVSVSNREFITAAREAVPALIDEVKKLRVEFCAIRERAKSFHLSPAELTARFVHVEAEFDAMETERDKLRAALREACGEIELAIRMHGPTVGVQDRIARLRKLAGEP